uniref:Peptidase n=1 Tax=viral metagenome TaxID=1070528 RepID=A0A6M3KLP6_9ZZZZ
MAGSVAKGRVVGSARVRPSSTALEVSFKLRIPGELIISGVPHPVLLGEPMNPDQADNIVHGLWDADARQIMIRAGVNDYTKVQALGHEWFHGIMDRAGRSPDNADEDIVQMTEEELCAMFGWAFLDLIVNNGTIEWVNIDPPPG